MKGTAIFPLGRFLQLLECSIAVRSKALYLRSLLLWGLLGVFLRLLFIPFTMHSDPRFTGDLIQMNHVAYVITHPSEDRADLLAYPPLAPYTMSILASVADSLTSFDLGGPVDGPGAMTEWISNPDIFRLLFILKSWYLLFDIGGALLMLRLFDDLTDALNGFKLWMLNPILIYDGYIHGQFDLVPIFFVVLALCLLKKGNTMWGSFCLGIGACYKSFPILFLPFLAVYATKSVKQSLTLLGLGAGPYLLSGLLMLTNYGPSLTFFSTYYFPLHFEPYPGQIVYLFIVAYAILLWVVWLRRPRVGLFEAMWKSMTLVLLMYYAQGVFDLHYLTWIVPMGILYIIEERRLLPVYAVLFVLISILYLPVSPGSFLLPLNPDLFGRLSPPFSDTELVTALPFLVSVARSCLIGTLLWWAYCVFRQITNAPEPEIIES